MSAELELKNQGQSSRGEGNVPPISAVVMTLFPRDNSWVKPYLTKQLGNALLPTAQLIQGPGDHKAGDEAAASVCLLGSIWPNIKLSSQAIFRTWPCWHGYHRLERHNQGPGTLLPYSPDGVPMTPMPSHKFLTHPWPL